MELDRSKSDYHLGYEPFKSGERGTRSHRYESILWGREATFDKECGDKVGPEYDAKNQWPKEEDIPGLRSSVSKYFGEMLSLSRMLTRLFALALNLDESFFDDKMDRPGSLLALNYYPANYQNMNASIPAHTDHELFTILLQSDNVKALEVVNGEGYWVPATPIPDTFVINIGDALSIWTNNLFLSTLHRATITTGVERYSIPFFFGANYDVVMETLQSCISESRPLKYKPVTAAEHYLNKMRTEYVSHVGP